MGVLHAEQEDEPIRIQDHISAGSWIVRPRWSLFSQRWLRSRPKRLPARGLFCSHSSFPQAVCYYLCGCGDPDLPMRHRPATKEKNVCGPFVPDVLGGVNNFFDAWDAQGDVHGGHAGKVEGFQRHLSAGLSDALGTKSPNSRAWLHLSSAGQKRGKRPNDERMFSSEGNDCESELMPPHS